MTGRRHKPTSSLAQCMEKIFFITTTFINKIETDEVLETLRVFTSNVLVTTEQKRVSKDKYGKL